LIPREQQIYSLRFTILVHFGKLFCFILLSLSSFNATLIIGLSIIPLLIYCRERNNRMK
jgi:hypothetical protein